MESLDQLRATYSGMTEDELAELAVDAYDLTDDARRALLAEISKRGIKIELKSAPPEASVPQPVAESDDDDDSDLVVVASPRSRNDAAKIQAVLNTAGIRSCLGADNAEDVRSFPGTFDQPVDLKVYLSYAGEASSLIERLRTSVPPELEKEIRSEEDLELEEEDDFLACCPKCHSEDVIFDGQNFDGQDPDPEVERANARYDWHCNSCRYRWQDDGIEDDPEGLEQ